MKNNLKTFVLGCSILCGLNLVGCDNINLTGTSKSTVNADQNSKNNNITTSTSLSFEDKFAFSSLFENEGVFSDSETIASQQSSFNTKGLLDTTTTVATDLNVVTDIAANLNATIDVSDSILSSIGRVDFKVKMSNVVTTKNQDGSTTNKINFDFTNKNSGNVKSDVVAKTYFKNNDSQIDHNLKVSFNSYTKTATRSKKTINTQTTVETESKSTLSNGTSIVIKETRSKNNGAEGEGSINITNSSGQTKTYNYTSQIDASGKLNIKTKDDKNMDINIVEKSKSNATITSNNESSDITTDISSESSLKAK